MRRFLQGLSPTTELVAVLVIAFGYIALLSVLDGIFPRPGAHHSTGSLALLVVYELFLIAVIAAFLGVRGWTLEKIGLVPSLTDSWIGVLLYIAAQLAWFFVWNLTAALAPDIARHIAAVSTGLVTHGLSMIAVGAVSIVNPIFEETFEVGYVIAALRGRVSPVVCVNVSVALRLVCHLYQGTLGVLSVIPVGLIFAYWYVRTGRLWPLIVAHALLDFISLAAFR
ncbi:MAG TPA: CPBP family intramembrane glutamic endopeptidase [Rhizomicrobium sp.]|nr:CPBP family intramembrane glutamic endopeptidase [Rhizomicrobium sp.]